MWAASAAALAVRSVVASVKKSILSVPVGRTISTQVAKGSTNLVSRMCETPNRHQKPNGRVNPFPARTALQTSFNQAKIAGPKPMATLQPLSSLGGMSLIAYMAVEATEGHIKLWNDWKPDVAHDLMVNISKTEYLSRELFVAKDRMEDLEMMVNDLTVFIEMQKEEIARLKQSRQ